VHFCDTGGRGRGLCLCDTWTGVELNLPGMLEHLYSTPCDDASTNNVMLLKRRQHSLSYRLSWK
jgi:hypothetical protein